jgi:hypothetical protein
MVYVKHIRIFIFNGQVYMFYNVCMSPPTLEFGSARSRPRSSVVATEILDARYRFFELSQDLSSDHY